VMARRTRLLAQVFYGRLFENDLFSSSISASNGVVWLLAALATPGVMLSGSQYYFYAHARTFAPELQDRILFVSQTLHILFAMAVAGLVTMMVWTSLTPDRRDALVLGTLPLNSGEQARARLLALLRFFSMFAVAVAVPTAVAFTFVTMGESSVVSVLARIAGHITSALLGAAWVFFVLVAMQLAIAAAFGASAVRVATLPLQALALAAVVAALYLNPRVADAMLGAEAIRDPWVMWNPPAWFVGLYRWISGDPRDVWALLASRAIAASVLAVAATLVGYPLAYRRCLRNALDGRQTRSTRWAGTWSRVWLRAMAPLLRTPLERGIATFIVSTLTRNHAHRFLIGSYIGIALLFALPLVGRLAGPAESAAVQYAWSSIPLGLLCWTAAALRVAMMLPVEPSSNWVFKLTEPVDKRRVLSTTVTVMQGATAFPLALLFGLASGIAGGPVLGVTVFAVVLGAGIVLIELLTLTQHTVPCTCTYRPGQLRLRVLWPLYLSVWSLTSYGLPRLAVWALDSVGRSAALIGALAGVWVALRVWRLARARQLRGFVYEEVEARATATLDLSNHRLHRLHRLGS
jgi:hypothetical protein